jgi:hypothetical protein
MPNQADLGPLPVAVFIKLDMDVPKMRNRKILQWESKSIPLF